LYLFPYQTRPEWSGIAHGCSHPDRNPDRNRLHDIDRQFDQLRAAGVTETLSADLSWTGADLTRFALPDRIALLVPGSSAHRPTKRWPARGYAELAGALLAQGITPVILGTAEESALAWDIRGAMPDTMSDAIPAAMPRAIDLTNRTSLPELASLARAACLAVGNDTGPMHLIAAAGCRSVVLFSRDSDPALTAPRGRSVSVLRRPDLADLDVSTVLAALTALGALPTLATSPTLAAPTTLAAPPAG
jgi:ADP-heptose:LPS heptosyltransferase